MLLAGLSAGLVTRRAPKAQVICTAAAAALCAVSLGGLLFERLSGGRAEFMHPWAFLLLLIPFAVLITHTVLRRIFSRQISYPLAHLRWNKLPCAYCLRAGCRFCYIQPRLF